MINDVSLSEEMDSSTHCQCELCGRLCESDKKTKPLFYERFGLDVRLTLLCLSCRSKLVDFKDIQKKYDKLESKVEVLNKKIALLSSMADKHNSCPCPAAPPVHHYNNIYYQNNNSSPPTDKQKFVRLLFHGKKVGSQKKILLSERKSSSNQNLLTSELKVSLNYSESYPLKDGNNMKLLTNVENSRNVLSKETSSRSVNIYSAKSCINEMIREFCENTSFHGFPEWYRAQNVYMKTLWVLIITFGLIGTGYEVFNVINDYRRAPTSTVYEFETPDDGLIFPQILLCNTNFLNASKVKKLNYSKATVNAAKFLILNPVEDVIGSVFDPTYSYLMKNLAESDVAAGSNYMPDVFENLQYDQKEFIKACFFDQQPCEIFNVSIAEAPDAEYGVCFLVKVNSLQTKSGEGLHLVLDTHSELWWTEQPTFGHGVVVRIERHYNPGVLRSYFVLPNYITKISLSAIHYKMMTTSNCRDDMVRKIFNSNVTYSEDICRMECFFRVALKHCGCIRSMPPEYLFEANLPQCFNSTQQMCLKDASVVEKYDSEAQNCKRQCIPPCDSWDYRAAISMLKFPAEPVIPVMEEMYNKSAKDSRFQDHVVLDIAFDQLRVTNIKQQVSITADGFLSQIGGHLGLFLGASLMSVVHMFVVFLQWFCRYVTQKVTRSARYLDQNGTV